MKLAIKIIKYIILVYAIIWLSFAFLTDNQISSYIKSYFVSSKKNYNKIKRLDAISLDSLFKTNLNSNFYFLSYYCGVCIKELNNAKECDSVKRKKVIYIITDNESTISDFSNYISKKKNIGEIYYLDDRYFKGMTHTKAWSVVRKYLPNYAGMDDYFPFTLQTDSLGNVVSLR